MSRELASDEKKAVKRPKPHEKVVDRQRPVGPNPADASGVLNLQKTVGNQAVQRLIAQRSGDGSFELDDTITNQINQARGGGHDLDTTVQTQMGQAMGHDFSGVRVHTSPEADGLNQQLGAKAFTTGQDVFFKQGAYNPGSSDGQELIAHELTHVVQQSDGRVGSSGGGMTVRPAGDTFEQEADAVAKQVVNPSQTSAVQTATDGGIQRQDEEELAMKRDETVQRQDEEELAMKRDETVQRQDEEELAMKRDETVQRQDEEELAMKRDETVQRQDEEELAMKRDETVQRQDEEELAMKRDETVQRMDVEDEELIQGKFVQRQEELSEKKV